MKGQSLYEAWQEEMAKQGQATLAWVSLRTQEQEAWKGLAAFLTGLFVGGR